MKSAVKSVLMMCVFCAVAFAQEKPNIAVYATGGKNAAENQAFIARITNAIVNSGQYKTIERTDIFLDQIAKEHQTQRSGAIDDKQISKIGKQFGAAFVCVGEIVEVFGDYQLSVRILNVESAQVKAMGMAEGPLRNTSDFVTLSDNAIKQMLDGSEKADAPPPLDKDSVIMQALQTIYFDPHEPELTQEAIKILNNIANVLKQYPEFRLMIESHADEQGTAGYNNKLSESRGRAVREYLVSSGINGRRIEVTGFGRKHLVNPNCNGDAKCHRRNRRVEWRVLAH